MSIHQYDVVIIGAGLSGVYCALTMDPSLRIAILSNGTIEDTNSYLAQGGVAAPIGPSDTPESHFDDTMSCGHFVNDEHAVRQLTVCAKEEIRMIEALGVVFDKNPDGSYLMGMEGAHHLPRILRIGDYTGKAILETLWKRVQERENIDIFTDAFVYELLSAEDHTISLKVLDKGEQSVFQSRSVVIATGGMGRLYSRTSNSEKIVGDGIALAIKSGIHVSHLNWIQFHPTVFYNVKGSQNGFLISEAVRGDGGMLLNQSGERFMEKYHPLKELAPRDIVSASILKELDHQTIPYVFLDVRHIGNDKMSQRFPTIYAYCREQGLDLDTDLIPVAPGAHYAMGGITVDLNGRTNLPNVYAVGECSYTGVHGKNRLASNSLLEAIVFAKKVSEAIGQAHLELSQDLLDITKCSVDTEMPLYDINPFRIRQWMDANMGIVKDYQAIRQMVKLIDETLQHPKEKCDVTIEAIQKQNMLLVTQYMLMQTLQEVDDENKQLI